MLCVLRDERVGFLGGLRNGLKVQGGSLGCEVLGKEVVLILFCVLGL